MRKRSIAAYLVAAVMLFTLAAERNLTLVTLRTRYNLDLADPLRNAPPSVVFTTVALGGFRGLLADVLWLRASYLQDRGDVFELVQLSDWITRLEPKCTEIWAFHAWNMAYNVSAMVSGQEDRWRWVKSGISLLRDKGLLYNGGDPQLYFELSWLFKNKIGQPMDRSNMYYRKRLAEEMTATMHGPRPDYAWLAAHPEAAEQLRLSCGLEPTMMAALDNSYGPFDWRLPDSHAAYWAYRGVLAAGDRGSLACERMLLQSLIGAFFEGDLVIRPEDGLFLTSPNIGVLPNVIKAFESTVSRRREKSLSTAYRSFLREATLLLYTFGRRDQAQATLDLLCRRFPDAANQPAIEAFVSSNIETALSRASRERVIAFAEGFFYQAFVWQAAGEKDKSAAAEAMALRQWNSYVAGKPAEVIEKLALPPVEDIRRHARMRAISDLPPAMSDKLRSEQGAESGARPK